MNKSDHEMLCTLGFTLVEEATDYLYWLYSITVREATLRLSWSLTDCSMQTSIQFDGTVISKVCSEGLTSCRATEDGVEGIFNLGDFVTTLRVNVHPALRVEWDTLRV